MPPRKRKVASRAPEPAGRRRSARASIGKKSSYFEDNSDDESEDVGRKAKRGRRAVEDDEDDYEDGGDDEEAHDSEKEEENEKVKDKEEADDDGDDDSDDDKPPKVTFIPHKQLRGLDGVEYVDERIHPNTMLFLRDLKANNRRTWLKENDAEYRRALVDWNSFVETLTARIIAEVDETIPELPARDVIFRIYRDIRFSHDSTPYKPHFSAAWSRTGRKGPYACYYVHCEPAGHCMVGGGLYHPDAAALQLLRASIDERPRRWRQLLAGTAPNGTVTDGDCFRRTFLKPAKQGDETAAIRAFTKLNTEGALRTKPKGFVADHRDIELLKLRNYTAMEHTSDSVFTDRNGQDKIIDLFKALSGLVTHLNRIVRPDPGDDDDDDDEEDEEDEEDEGES